jgi:hypothetical protein
MRSALPGVTSAPGMLRAEAALVTMEVRCGDTHAHAHSGTACLRSLCCLETNANIRTHTLVTLVVRCGVRRGGRSSQRAVVSGWSGVDAARALKTAWAA